MYDDKVLRLLWEDDPGSSGQGLLKVNYGYYKGSYLSYSPNWYLGAYSSPVWYKSWHFKDNGQLEQVSSGQVLAIPDGNSDKYIRFTNPNVTYNPITVTVVNM